MESKQEARRILELLGIDATEAAVAVVVVWVEVLRATIRRSG